jgi:hypothetical protein
MIRPYYEGQKADYEHEKPNYEGGSSPVRGHYVIYLLTAKIL